jgi:hypothetical protein
MPTLLEDLNYFLEQTLETTPRFLCEPPYRRLHAFIEANTPWLPPQQEGFGPWIEWEPGDPGPRIGDIVCILRGANRDKRMWYRQTFEGPAKQWSWGGNDIVAYCVKLPDAYVKAAGRKNAFENGCGND